MNDETPAAVTGGDLVALWRAANTLLPQVQGVYVDQIQKIHSHSGSLNEMRYGKCHLLWTLVASELGLAMFMTEGSLEMKCSALNRAIDAYTHVDGNGAEGLTDLGEELDTAIEMLLEVARDKAYEEAKSDNQYDSEGNPSNSDGPSETQEQKTEEGLAQLKERFYVVYTPHPDVFDDSSKRCTPCRPRWEYSAATMEIWGRAPRTSAPAGPGAHRHRQG